MRSQIRKHLVKTFRQAFEKQHPQFSLLKLDSSAIKVWEWRIAPNLHFFVGLQPFEQEDVFVLEIAWNEKDEFPWASMGKPLVLDSPSGRERLAGLWQREAKEPVWDAAPEVGEAMQARFDAMQRGEEVSDSPPPTVDVVIPRIAPLVDDCLRKFQEYGIPVFEQAARHRGLDNFFTSCEKNRSC